MANPYRIKDNANHGIYMGREVFVFERNHIFGFAIIKKPNDLFSIKIPLSALH